MCELPHEGRNRHIRQCRLCAMQIRVLLQVLLQQHQELAGRQAGSDRVADIRIAFWIFVAIQIEFEVAVAMRDQGQHLG
jgi:hypothetical protein